MADNLDKKPRTDGTKDSAGFASTDRGQQIMQSATSMPLTSNKTQAVTREEFEVGHDLLKNRTGFIVGARGQALMRLATETPLVTIGKTGAGKGVSAAITNLLDHEGSAFSLEIGGTTLKNTYNYRKSVLGQKVYVFDPHNITGLGNAHYNPLDDLDPEAPEFFSNVMTLARSLTKTDDGKQENQVYFQTKANDLIAAMIVYLKLADEASVPLRQRNLVHIAKIFSTFPSEEWDRYINELKRWKGKYRILLNGCGNYLGTAKNGDENARAIVSSTAGWLSFLADDDLSKYLTKSDFSMRDLRNDKITIYMVMEGVDHFITYHPWLRFMVENAINFVPNYADGGKGFEHKDRILFMIDEMTHLGKLDAVMTGAQTARQKGITFWSMFQNMGDLIHVYGKEKAQSFIAASECVQIFQVTEPETLEYIAKYAGRKLVYIPSVSESITEGTAKMTNWSISNSHSEQVSEQITKNWADTTNQGTADSKGTSNSHGTSQSSGNNNGFGGGGLHFGGNSSNGINSTWGDNHSFTTQQGTSHQDGGGTSDGKNSGDTNTNQEGGGDSTNHGQTRTIQYAPQIIPAVDIREILGILSGESQLLFINNQRASRMFLDFQARFYKSDELIERANGPELLPPPRLPQKSSIQPAGSFLAAAEALTKATSNRGSEVRIPTYQEITVGELTDDAVTLKRTLTKQLEAIEQQQVVVEKKKAEIVQTQIEQEKQKRELTALETTAREKTDALAATPKQTTLGIWRNRKQYEQAEQEAKVAAEARHKKLLQLEGIKADLEAKMNGLTTSLKELNDLRRQCNALLQSAVPVIETIIGQCRNFETALARDQKTYQTALDRVKSNAAINSQNREKCRIAIQALRQQAEEIKRIVDQPNLVKEWRSHADHLRGYYRKRETWFDFGSYQYLPAPPKADLPRVETLGVAAVDWDALRKTVTTLKIPAVDTASGVQLPPVLESAAYNHDPLVSFASRVKVQKEAEFSPESAAANVRDLLGQIDRHASGFRKHAALRNNELRSATQSLHAVSRSVAAEQDNIQKSLYELLTTHQIMTAIIEKVNGVMPTLYGQVIGEIRESVVDIYEKLERQSAELAQRGALAKPKHVRPVESRANLTATEAELVDDTSERQDMTTQPNARQPRP